MKDIVTTTVRIPRDAYEIVVRVSEDRGETVSAFVRRAVLRELAALSFLPTSQKKALGVSVAEVPAQ